MTLQWTLSNCLDNNATENELPFICEYARYTDIRSIVYFHSHLYLYSHCIYHVWLRVYMSVKLLMPYRNTLYMYADVTAQFFIIHSHLFGDAESARSLSTFKEMGIVIGSSVMAALKGILFLQGGWKVMTFSFFLATLSAGSVLDGF